MQLNRTTFPGAVAVRRFIVFVGLLVSVAAVQALAEPATPQNNQRFIPLDSPIYPLLQNVRAEEALAPDPLAYPYSVEQAETLLAAVDPSRLSAAGRAAYDRIRALLHPTLIVSLPTFGLGLNATLSPEFYWKLTKDTDWQYGYADRKSLADVGLNLYGGTFLYGGGNLDLKEGHFAENVPGNFTNINSDFSYYDVQFPFRAFISLGTGFFNFQLGRDDLQWGPGQSGQLVLSATPDYFDFGKLSFFWNVFRYTGLFVSIPPLITGGEQAAGAPTNGYKSLILHRFDVTAFNRINFAVVEGQMVGPALPDISYFNPLMILHDFYDWSNASEIFSVETEFRPLRYVSLYGQLAFNQIQTAYETARYGAGAVAIPNAAGYLFGGDVRYPLGRGYLAGGGEYVHTDPWMYIRESPYTSYFWRRNVLSNLLGSNVTITLPIGYWLGPDSNIGYFWAEYRVDPEFSVHADLSLISDGLNTVDTPYANGAAAVALTTPSGTPSAPAEYSTIAHFSGTWNPGSTFHSRLLEHLDLSTDLFLIGNRNFNHQPGVSRFDVQVAISAALHL